jgi:pilus assembly protein Flp/PilA
VRAAAARARDAAGKARFRGSGAMAFEIKLTNLARGATDAKGSAELTGARAFWALARLGSNARPTAARGRKAGAGGAFLESAKMFTAPRNAFVTLWLDSRTVPPTEHLSRRGTRMNMNNRSTDMTTIFSRFVKDESGATAIEYGLIASLISIAAIAAFTSVGTKLSATFGYVAGQLNT